ncbi:hypothetical protein N781_09170 [Pontibacillus halophilus JSM 076056 = DSM 19796]|uniref:Uncharacterized protein n=1 Tax=Pontibacillus halophilus JSM 076056 = DSM 19796 TaxID=1385510 RepID=A0A0A5G8E6_9BACI|nr:hypothetical protein [Pontibacillus halophilus]KGX89411.1 hypothetical protein N781_09170 [Pontibacillus halophilus JSM 076056 = DSM 19796]
MMKQNRKWLLVLVVIVLVAGGMLYSAGYLKTGKQAAKAAEASAEQVFYSDHVETNESLEHVSLYVPEHMEVSKEQPNNIQLNSNGQKYLVFYNPYEQLTSDTFYESAKAEDELLIQSFQSDEATDKASTDRFGYIRVLALEDDYELQVSVGGVKMTTVTEKHKLDEDAKDMMEVVLSIAYETSKGDTK